MKKIPESNPSLNACKTQTNSLKEVLLIPLFLLVCIAASAQVTDSQLAIQYYNTGEFDKAALYYEKLFDKSPSNLYYNHYYKCLLQLNDLKKAEKLVKRRIKQEPTNATYYIDLADVYILTGEESKAKQQYETAIKKVYPNIASINHLANRFNKSNLTDYALATYKRGKKIVNSNYDFNYEIANVLGQKGLYTEMFEEYMKLLFKNPRYENSIKNNLIRILDFKEGDARVDKLRRVTLKMVQNNPNKQVFADLLIWIFIQKKDFNSALIQSKAIDKRNQENGQRLMELGKICYTNKNYAIAEKAYLHITNQGISHPSYEAAKINLLNVYKEKITGNYTYTEADLLALETNYESTLDKIGKTTKTVAIIRELANLKAFYLKKDEEAIELLEKAIEIPQINSKDKAKCKIELGDILVFNDKIWDASLLYSQVEYDFKEDVIGQEAKFKNAKIHYYTGNFDLAQAQLDILKASTSKLISNDAIELSLLIQDNLALDTTPTPMLMFAKADLLTAQNKFVNAEILLDSLSKVFPTHSLSDEVLYQKALIAERKGEFEKASTLLTEIITYYYDDILADNALFKLAEIQENRFQNLEKAKKYYRQLITDYPGSLFVVETRKRFRALRGDQFN